MVSQSAVEPAGGVSTYRILCRRFDCRTLVFLKHVYENKVVPHGTRILGLCWASSPTLRGLVLHRHFATTAECTVSFV